MEICLPRIFRMPENRRALWPPAILLAVLLFVDGPGYRAPRSLCAAWDLGHVVAFFLWSYLLATWNPVGETSPARQWGGSSSPSVSSREPRRRESSPCWGGRLARGSTPGHRGRSDRPVLVRPIVKGPSRTGAADGENGCGNPAPRRLPPSRDGVERRGNRAAPVSRSVRLRDPLRDQPIGWGRPLLGGSLRRPERKGIPAGGHGYLPLLRRCLSIFPEELEGIPFLDNGRSRPVGGGVSGNMVSEVLKEIDSRS